MLTPRLLALVPAAVAINLAVGRLVAELSLPVYLDTLGTILAAGLMGPVAGITVGLVSQVIAALVSGYQWIAFAPIQVIIALCAALAASRAGFRGPLVAAGWGLATGLVGGATSSVISYFAFRGVTAGGVTAVGALLRSIGLPLELAVTVASISTDLLDKVVSFLLVGLALRSLPLRLASRYPWAMRGLGRAQAGPHQDARGMASPDSPAEPLHRYAERRGMSSRLPVMDLQPAAADAALHPFTPFVAAVAILVLAFVLPAPWGPPALYLAVVVTTLGAGLAKAARNALIICLPLWALLLILHGLLGDPPRISLLALRWSESGLRVAVAQAGRFGAIITASLAVFSTFRPSRFIDAVAARGWSFHAAYLLVATLEAAPRFRRRAAAIIESQRSRGLRLGGGLGGRLRAFVPLVLPLVLGALSEVDERAVALETRGIASGGHRTPLDPPAARLIDRMVLLAVSVIVTTAVAWRFAS